MRDEGSDLSILNLDGEARFEHRILHPENETILREGFQLKVDAEGIVDFEIGI